MPPHVLTAACGFMPALQAPMSNPQSTREQKQSFHFWEGSLWAAAAQAGCRFPWYRQTCKEGPNLEGPPLDAHHEHAGDGQAGVGTPLLEALPRPPSPGVDVDSLPPHVDEKQGRQEELGGGVGPG